MLSFNETKKLVEFLLKSSEKDLGASVANFLSSQNKKFDGEIFLSLDKYVPGMKLSKEQIEKIISIYPKRSQEISPLKKSISPIASYPLVAEMLKAELSELDWASLLAHHRFLYLAFQNLHWTAQGSSYYGDHLLFQRLYEKVGDEVDQIAERAVGMGHVTAVQGDHLAPLLLNPIDLGLVFEVEKTLAHALSDFEANASSLGVKDLLATLASSREEDLYLLGQRVK